MGVSAILTWEMITQCEERDAWSAALPLTEWAQAKRVVGSSSTAGLKASESYQS